MVNLDNVRNSVIHLVGQQKKDGKMKGGHSRQQFRILICKNLLSLGI